MNRETSIYLDIVRFLAAMTVFLGHVSGQRLTGGFLWQIGGYMQEAVTVFFVLSGFVIAYVTKERETTGHNYAVNRLSRIYSVALPILLLTFTLDALGRAVNPAVYNETWGYHADGALLQFFSGLVFINETWFSRVPVGSDLPYWSIGFEVWYYVLFGIILFARHRLLWAALVIAVTGPSIISLFPVWLLGVLTYHLLGRLRLSCVSGLAVWVCSLAGLVGYEIWAARHGRPYGYPPEWLRRPELVQDYLIGCLFAANVLGFAAAAPLFSAVLARIAPIVRWCAGLTFTLYLAHLPIAQALMAFSPWPLDSWPNRILVIGGTLAGVVALGTMIERRKSFWRQLFTFLLAGPRKMQPG